MSTRSAILIQDGKDVAGIYCHFDGYPEGVGATLFEHYKDVAKVRELIALGDISSLGTEIGVKHAFDSKNDIYNKMVTAYHRDRGEKLHITRGKTVAEVAKHIGHNGYIYIFRVDKNCWYIIDETSDGSAAKEAIPFAEYDAATRLDENAYVVKDADAV